MPIAKESSSFEPAPAGTRVARCFGCISLGTQHSEMYADAFKVMLTFELPGEVLETQEGPMPMTVSKEYTLSLNKKSTLRKHLDAWRGRAFTKEELDGFEVSKVVGAPCLLTIIHQISGQGNTYAKIESITGLAKGMTCPPQKHKSVVFEVNDGNQSDTFKSLPEWIQKKIAACEEWKPQDQQVAAPQDNQGQTNGDGEDDDVPF